MSAYFYLFGNKWQFWKSAFIPWGNNKNVLEDKCIQMYFYCYLSFDSFDLNDNYVDCGSFKGLE